MNSAAIAFARRRPFRSRVIAKLVTTVPIAVALAAALLFETVPLSAGCEPSAVDLAGGSANRAPAASGGVRSSADVLLASTGQVVLVHGAQAEAIPYATLAGQDRAAIEMAVADVAPRFEAMATDATVQLGPDGSFVVVPAVVGWQVDRLALTDAIVRALAAIGAGGVTVQVPGTAIEPIVSTAEAQAAASLAESATAPGLTLTTPDGERTFTVAARTLRSWIAFKVTADGGCRPTFVTAAARAGINAYRPKVAVDPRDATFVWGNNGVVRVVAGADGRALEIGQTLTAINAALFGSPAGTPGAAAPSVTLVITTVAPRLSTAEASEIAPRMRPLHPKGPDGRPGWTTWYEVSERNYWSRNITIPARKLNGRMLLPGDTFGFWKGIGEVSRRTGYGPGGAIINGRTQPTGALAGGICSASTTLFNAAVRAGLKIIERHHHYYYIGRYPVGLDATVSKPRQDMVFQNDTAYPIVIRSSASPGIVHFEIWGVPDGRKTTFHRSAKRNYRRAIDTVVYSSYLRPGVRVRIEAPTDGFDVSVTRIVRDRSGNVIRRDVFSSHYARVNGVLAIGTGR